MTESVRAAVRRRAVLVDLDRIGELVVEFGGRGDARRQVGESSQSATGRLAEHALDVALAADLRDAERGGAALPCAYVNIVELLAVPCGRAREGTIAFNELPADVRSTFFDLFLDGRAPTDGGADTAPSFDLARERLRAIFEAVASAVA